MGHGPILGEGLAGFDLQRLLVVLDGLLQVLGPLAADAVDVGIAQVVLGSRPTFGEGSAGFDFQRLLIVLDGLLQVLGPLAADAQSVGDRQVVLGSRPLLRDRPGGCRLPAPAGNAG